MDRHSPNNNRNNGIQSGGNRNNRAFVDNTSVVRAGVAGGVVRGIEEGPAEPIYMQMSFHSPSVSTIGMDSVATVSANTAVPTINSRADLQRRTVEDARRHIRDNFNVMLQPLVDTARFMNVTNLLHHHQSTAQAAQLGAATSGGFGSGVPASVPGTALPPAAIALADPNSIVVNLDEHSDQHSNAGSNLAVNDSNNDLAHNTDPNNMEVTAETQAALVTLLRYVPFLLLLLVKSLYIHHEGILNLVILFITFVHCNNVVKKEATKGPKRNKSKLLLALLYIVICMAFINYVFEEERLYMHLVFMHTFTKPLTVWDLLWFVAVNDFMLKLITISIKIFITLMPGALLQFKKRGKIYLAIEATSQLYRSAAPNLPWLRYLTESQHKSFFIFGLILAALYLIFKSVDLYTYAKFVKSSIEKLFQNVSIGSCPSKEQIQAAGEHCPICHDAYEAPVLLHCRHIFCENCVTTWFDREQTCPLCRAKIVDDPSWRDGSTTFFMQLF